jgi:periplasmic protein TonB
MARDKSLSASRIHPGSDDILAPDNTDAEKFQEAGRPVDVDDLVSDFLQELNALSGKARLSEPDPGEASDTAADLAEDRIRRPAFTSNELEEPILESDVPSNELDADLESTLNEIERELQKVRVFVPCEPAIQAKDAFPSEPAKPAEPKKPVAFRKLAQAERTAESLISLQGVHSKPETTASHRIAAVAPSAPLRVVPVPLAVEQEIGESAEPRPGLSSRQTLFHSHMRPESKPSHWKIGAWASALVFLLLGTSFVYFTYFAEGPGSAPRTQTSAPTPAPAASVSREPAAISPPVLPPKAANVRPNAQGPTPGDSEQKKRAATKPVTVQTNTEASSARNAGQSTPSSVQNSTEVPRPVTQESTQQKVEAPPPSTIPNLPTAVLPPVTNASPASAASAPPASSFTPPVTSAANPPVATPEKKADPPAEPSRSNPPAPVGTTTPDFTKVPDRVTASSSVLTPAVAIKKVVPIYPQAAQRSRIGGTVEIEVQIGTKGEVTGVRAISGPTLLRAAAEEAVKLWQFKPALRNGVNLPSILMVSVKFNPN